jgi:hypothetical protein
LDAHRFDALIKRAALARVTRWSVLRGLAAGGVAAVTGLRLTGEAEAGDKKKRRRTICHCHGSNVNQCTQGKIRGGKKLRKHLRTNACDYAGTCQAANPRCGTGGTTRRCAGNTDCAAGLACIQGACQPCTLASQCNGLLCLDGVCVGGASCTAPGDCEDPLACLPLGGEEVCLLDNECESDAECVDPLLPVCLLGLCVEECLIDTDCPVDQSCVLGICGETCDSVDDCEPLGVCVLELGICLNLEIEV